MMNSFAEEAAAQSLLQEIGDQDLGHGFQEIARSRVSLHLHADFAGDPCAADYDGCVFPKQGGQRGNTPVGCARNYGLRHGRRAVSSPARLAYVARSPATSILPG